MKVVIQQADVPNLNGRIYPKDLLEKVIESQSLMGMVGMNETSTLELEKVSHKVENLRMENGYLVGELKILSTPMGKTLSQLPYNENSFRLSGVGTVDKDGRVENFSPIAINYTKDPA